MAFPRHALLVSVVAPALVLLSAGAVAAQASAEASDGTAYGMPAEEEAETSRLPPGSYYDLGFSYQFRSDVQGGGNFQLWSGWLDGVYDVDFTDRWSVVTRFGYRADVYDFQDAPAEDSIGFPLLTWGLIHTPRAQLLGAYRFGDAWRIYVGPVLEFSFEGGANIRDAFRPGAVAAVEWTIHDDLRAGLGLIAVQDVDSSFYGAPILLLDWNVVDGLALHLESWTTRGGEIELGWRPLDQLEVAAAVGYRREYFRLNERDDGTPPPAIPTPLDVSNGLVEDRAYTAALRVSWLPRVRWVNDVFGDLRIDLDATANYVGKLRIRDGDGNSLSVKKYDVAPSIGLTLHVPL